MIGDDDRPLSTAHEPRLLAEKKDLEAVGQRTKQFQRAEDVEQLEAIEQRDADAPWRTGLVDGPGGSPPRAR